MNRDIQKYDRDFNNVVDTARDEGKQSLLLRQLSRKLGEIPISVQEQVRRLHGDRLDDLGDVLFELGSVEELEAWLRQGI